MRDRIVRSVGVLVLATSCVVMSNPITVAAARTKLPFDWTQLTPPNSPPGRASVASDFDAANESNGGVRWSHQHRQRRRRNVGVARTHVDAVHARPLAGWAPRIDDGVRSGEQPARVVRWSVVRRRQGQGVRRHVDLERERLDGAVPRAPSVAALRLDPRVRQRVEPTRSLRRRREARHTRPTPGRGTARIGPGCRPRTRRRRGFRRR